MSSIRSPSRTKNPSPTSKKRSQLQNQSQSQNGGRRRKNTMRKLRRGRKSRKVMRGGVGAYDYDFTKFESSNIINAINRYKVQKGYDQPLFDNLDKILENEIGKKLTESTDISPASKLGIMLILDPRWIESQLGN